MLDEVMSPLVAETVPTPVLKAQPLASLCEKYFRLEKIEWFSSFFPGQFLFLKLNFRKLPGFVSVLLAAGVFLIA